MAWRPYIVSNKYGKRQAMRDTKLYDSKEDAIASMKNKNKAWMRLNYDKTYTKSSDFEYGAINVGKSKHKFKVGREGNQDLLKHHDSLKKQNTTSFNFKY